MKVKDLLNVLDYTFKTNLKIVGNGHSSMNFYNEGYVYQDIVSCNSFIRANNDTINEMTVKTFRVIPCRDEDNILYSLIEIIVFH